MGGLGCWLVLLLRQLGSGLAVDGELVDGEDERVPLVMGPRSCFRLERAAGGGLRCSWGLTVTDAKWIRGDASVLSVGVGCATMCVQGRSWCKYL